MLRQFRLLWVLGMTIGLLGTLTRPVLGQAVAVAQIAGTVTDPSGAAVASALVTATQTETNTVHTATTDANGGYTLPNLPVGPYRLEVAAAGFSTYLRTGILLSVGNSVTINVPLTLGSTQQQIQVTANAAMVETRDTATSQVIDQQRVLDLPLNGREASSLVLLSGAAVDATSMGTDLATTKNYGSANINATSAISVAGGQASGTNYMMDGGDNNDGYSNVNLPFPFPDAIQEFSVQTNGLSARYGVHPGGAINIVTKSGTNGIHGDLFEFLRNGDLNARNYFAATHDSLRRNQFGGTVGGPVKNDHIFFFFGYQGTRIRTAPPSTISYVATQAALNGDFSQLESATCQSNGKSRNITNPTNGQIFPGAQVPVSLLNAQALALLKYVPISGNPCGTIIYGVPSAEDENQYIGRMDWVKNEKQSLFVRYFRTNLNNPPPPFNNNVLQTNVPGLLDQSQAAVVGETYAFSPTALNSVHLSFTRPVINRLNAPDGINPKTVGIDISVGGPNFMQLTVNNYFAVGCGTCASSHTAHTYMQAADDFDWIRGHHHFAFGGSWMHEQTNSSSIYVANGQWTFNGTFTGDSLVDFMLGSPSSFVQGNRTTGAARQQYIGAYAQDDFQVSHRLQLHFGLRWEPFLAATDEYSRGYYFDPAAYLAGAVSKVYLNAPPGLKFIGDPGVPRGYAPNKYNDFEPRTGFAWDISGNGRQTLRASYGIFYESPVLFFAASRTPQSPPWGSNVTLTSPPNGLTNPFQAYGGSDPFPTPSPTSTVPFNTQGVYINVPQPIRPTYEQEWSISYQHQLSVNWMFSATYMGNKLTHNWAATEENPAVYIPGTCNGSPCSSTKNTAQRRVLSLENPVAGNYYSTIALSDDGSNSEYNAALFSVQHRFSDYYTVLANYTYSHCIAEGTMVGDLTGPQYQNPYNRDADRANCRFDIRHLVNLSLVARSPQLGSTWMRRIVGNWQLAPLLSIHSGTWFSPLTGVDNSLTGVSLDRPNMVPGIDPYVRDMNSRQWLNAAAFLSNPVGTFGNAGPYSLEGPGYVDLDLGLSRNFKLRESTRLEARFENFNSLNHTNFANPSGTLTSAQFGRITSALAPRILQFAMKLTF